MESTSFRELVVMRTKLAGILPFIIGVLFTIHLGYRVDWANTVILAVVTLLLAVGTSAIGRLRTSSQPTSDVVSVDRTSRALPIFLVQLILVVMLTIAVCLGIWLVWRTNLVLLLFGLVGFGIALFYTLGPVPLSRLPLGEVFVGGTLGLLLPFTAVYVNVPSHELAGIMLHWPGMLVWGNLSSLLAVGLLCMPLMATTANLIFAENILRLGRNQANTDKHTLPEYLGLRWSVIVYRSFLVIGVVGIAIGMVTGLLSWWLAIVALALPVIFINDRHFMQTISTRVQETDAATDNWTMERRQGLRPAISNFVWLNGLLIIGLLLEMVVG